MKTRDRVVALWPEYKRHYGGITRLARLVGVSRQRVQQVLEEERLSWDTAKTDELAYHLRYEERQSWERVAHGCGFLTTKTAKKAAVQHAAKYGLPAPRFTAHKPLDDSVVVKKAREALRLRDQRDSIGQEIAKCLEYSSVAAVYMPLISRLPENAQEGGNR